MSFNLFVEPSHLHIQKKKNTSKYWIFSSDDFELAENQEFTSRDLNSIETILLENNPFVLAKYEPCCHENNLKAKRKGRKPANFPRC
ncbi:DUF4160 domain-containing protein [Persicitalea jodogahamensis]|uniref:DUF4160 domain-containing protein n=1 Tax=Persicitalea jodogahamensis TaxID=402147 RepID=UPI00167272A3